MTTSHRADPGLFGPESVTWRIHAEPILWVAGVRALLLQALHPRAMAGVAQNSNFRRDSFGRLMRTAEFVGTVVYGTTDAARRAGARIRGVHRRLSARDPVTGELFRVDEPDLLTWVHVSEVESFLTTARRAGLTLTGAEADRYYAEQVRAAELVGLDPGVVPASVAEVDAYFRRTRPQLRMTVEAADAALFVMAPPMPWGLGWTPARPVWAGIASLAFSLLPAWARRMYGGLGLPTTDLGASVTVRGLRSALALLPAAWREGPMRQEAVRRLAATPPQSA